MSPLVVATLAGLLGLAAGSFANVVIQRAPRREPVGWPEWRCPACGTPTAWPDSLPLVGWLLRRGRCRSCRAPIPVRHLLVELAMGLLWFVVALRLTWILELVSFSPSARSDLVAGRQKGWYGEGWRAACPMVGLHSLSITGNPARRASDQVAGAAAASLPRQPESLESHDCDSLIRS